MLFGVFDFWDFEDSDLTGARFSPRSFVSSRVITVDKVDGTVAVTSVLVRMLGMVLIGRLCKEEKALAEVLQGLDIIELPSLSKRDRLFGESKRLNSSVGILRGSEVGTT